MKNALKNEKENKGGYNYDRNINTVRSGKHIGRQS